MCCDAVKDKHEYTLAQGYSDAQSYTATLVAQQPALVAAVGNAVQHTAGEGDGVIVNPAQVRN